ncbi:hypothetical protein ACROYT_G003180 [Oculina patagonica]
MTHLKWNSDSLPLQWKRRESTNRLRNKIHDDDFISYKPSSLEEDVDQQYDDTWPPNFPRPGKRTVHPK